MAAAALPIFETVSPSDLLVDEEYQRNLSERSVVLIRKIVGNWDWRRFKPPIVARTTAGFEIIDGQHTAIAAATHPSVDLIPVMVVEAVDRTDRASAFLGHNKDRIALTANQLHAAAVTAGDEDALDIERVCEKAGVRVLRYPPPNGAWKARDTLAVSTIRALIKRQGVIKAREVLQVLANAECAPVSAGDIKAIEVLLTEKEYADAKPADLTTAVRALGPLALTEARIFSASHRVPIWRALAVVYYRRSQRGRRRAA